MKRVKAILDRIWASWDSLFDGLDEAIEQDIKEFEKETGGKATKSVTTESRDGFTYKVTTVTTETSKHEGIVLGVREVARLIAHCYDNDDWVSARLQVLRAQGEDAKARVQWVKRPDGHIQFQVSVKRANGTVETKPQLSN